MISISNQKNKINKKNVMKINNLVFNDFIYIFINNILYLFIIM